MSRSTPLTYRFLPRCLSCLSIYLMLLAGNHAVAQEALIKERQEGFKAMGSAMKSVRDQLKSGAIDTAKMTEAANTMAVNAAKIPHWFPASSGSESGVETDALAYIWENTEKFSTLTDTMITAAQDMETAAASGDEATIKKQFLAVKDSCSACHKSFRAD